MTYTLMSMTLTMHSTTNLSIEEQTLNNECSCLQATSGKQHAIVGIQVFV